MGKLDELRKAVERNNELLVEQNRLLREALSGRPERGAKDRAAKIYLAAVAKSKTYPELAVIPGNSIHNTTEDESYGPWEPEGA